MWEGEVEYLVEVEDMSRSHEFHLLLHASAPADTSTQKGRSGTYVTVHDDFLDCLAYPRWLG